MHTMEIYLRLVGLELVRNKNQSGYVMELLNSGDVSSLETNSVDLADGPENLHFQ